MGELIRTVGNIPGTEVLHEHAVSGGLYYEDDDGVIRHLAKLSPRNMFDGFDPSLPYPAIAERLEYNIHADGVGESSVQTGFFGAFHPDESETPHIVHGILEGNRSPRFEVLNTHSLASAMGRREYVLPVSEAISGFHIEGIVWMRDGRERAVNEKGSVTGAKVDLNRMFPVNPHAQTPEEAVSGIRYAPARMLIQFLRDHPQLEYVFTFHEDLAFEGSQPRVSGNGHGPWQGGFYMYDTVYDARKDPDSQLVRKLHGNLSRELKASGFEMFTGVDDPDDPDLGNPVTDGLVRTPVVTEDGVFTYGRSFEHAMVALNRWSVGSVERAFTLEIPGRMSRGDKERLVGLVMQHFVVPFLTAKGVPFKYP